MNSANDLIHIELVIFDLAGTIVEDGGEVPAAFRSALAEHGILVSAEQLKNVRGGSKRDAILQLIPPGPERASRAVSVYASFRQQLAQRYQANGVRPVEGAVTTFHHSVSATLEW